jgi:hypothetical protein
MSNAIRISNAFLLSGLLLAEKLKVTKTVDPVLKIIRTANSPLP